jgi:hypothetical protein
MDPALQRDQSFANGGCGAKKPFDFSAVEAHFTP